VKVSIAVECHEPVAELVCKEVTLTATVALDVGMWAEDLETTAGAGELLATSHCLESMLEIYKHYTI